MQNGLEGKKSLLGRKPTKYIVLQRFGITPGHIPTNVAAPLRQLKG